MSVQGWTHEQALEAIEEYRRFCFLACVAGAAVTPSDQVDEVWHQHLTHTRVRFIHVVRQSSLVVQVERASSVAAAARNGPDA